MNLPKRKKVMSKEKVITLATKQMRVDMLKATTRDVDVRTSDLTNKSNTSSRSM